MKNKVIVSVVFLSSVLSLFFLMKCDDNIKESVDGLNQLLRSMTPVSDVMPAEMPATFIKDKNTIGFEYNFHTDFFEEAEGSVNLTPLFPASDAIYPGALIKGESVLDKTYSLLDVKRNPLQLNTAVTEIGSVSFVVNDPTAASVKEAVSGLIQQAEVLRPASSIIGIEPAYSESQMYMSLHAASRDTSANLADGFRYSDKRQRTRLVFKVVRSYYSVDMELPENPSDLFREYVGKSVFGQYMPMYVSSVEYGYMVLFTVDSKLDYQVLSSSLYDALAAAESSLTYPGFSNLIARSKIVAYEFSSSGIICDTINVFDDFKKYVNAGRPFSKETPGVPVSFSLRYVGDNSLAKIVQASSYTVHKATPRTDHIYDISVLLHSFDIYVPCWYCQFMNIIGSIQSRINGRTEVNSYFSSTAGNQTGVIILTDYNPIHQSHNDVLFNDVVVVTIKLTATGTPAYWFDNPPTETYGTVNFSIPVSEIVDGVNASDDRVYKKIMKVTGINQSYGQSYINTIMHFSYSIPKLEKQDGGGDVGNQ